MSFFTEAKRLLGTGELFPRGTAEEPHAPVEESAAPAVAAAPKRAAMSLFERLVLGTNCWYVLVCELSGKSLCGVRQPPTV